MNRPTLACSRRSPLRTQRRWYDLGVWATRLTRGTLGDVEVDVRRRLCLIFIAAVAARWVSGGTITSSPPDDLLPSLEAAVSAIETITRRVDPSTLPVQYSEGRIIAQRKLDLEKVAAVVRKAVANLRADNTVTTNVNVYVVTNTLSSGVEGLSTLLASPITYSDAPAQKRSLQWASDLADANEQLTASILMMRTHLVHVTNLADTLLAACDGKK